MENARGLGEQECKIVYSEQECSIVCARDFVQRKSVAHGRTAASCGEYRSRMTARSFVWRGFIPCISYIHCRKGERRDHLRRRSFYPPSSCDADAPQFTIPLTPWLSPKSIATVVFFTSAQPRMWNRGAGGRAKTSAFEMVSPFPL